MFKSGIVNLICIETAKHKVQIEVPAGNFQTQSANGSPRWKLPNTKCILKYPLETAKHKVYIEVPAGNCQTQSVY